jgi:hypothetical protein
MPVIPFVCIKSLVNANAEMLVLVVYTLLAVCSLAVIIGFIVFATAGLIAKRKRNKLLKI